MGGFLNSVTELTSGALDAVPTMSTFSDVIGDILGTTLQNTVGQALYFVAAAVNWFISLAYQLFEVFSGQTKVSYKGETNFLTNIFFENSTVAGIYWGMAIIGVVLCFAFTIIAVIRKMFDGSDKMQTTMGAILGSTIKSILLILSLNFVMVVVLNFTNVLMQRVVYVFNAGSSLTEEQRIDFTDDQFATMGRVLNTIGNYSLNPSYNSRYNLNSCFNEIRGDMLYLQQQGVFDFYYITENADGEEIETWQSALQTLVFAANLEEEQKLDVYHEGISNALLNIMETLRTNSAFYPLEYYERDPAPIHNIPFDRVLFLACTYNAALNEQFNINPSHTDPLRGPYYNGEKSIYDFEQVAKDFNLVWGFNYVMFGLIVYGIFKEMMYILMDCIARIYNMVILYLVAPPFIAVSPLDGGGKMKQWMTAFIVQCFGVFGTVISMRLMLTFAPIVISTDLQFFANPVMDIAAKVIMIQASCLACRKASAMFSGILADSAGWQSITAGSLRSDYDAQQKEAKAEKEKAAQQKQQQQQAAMSAAKLAAGGGNLEDVKNVGQAVQNEMNDKTGGGGGTPEQTNLGGTQPEQTDTGSTQSEQTDTGGTTEQTNLGGSEQTNLGGTTEQTDTGGTQPEQTNLGSDLGGGNQSDPSIGSIPVPPPFTPNQPTQPQQSQQPTQPQQPPPGEGDPPKSPPPGPDNNK